MVRHGLKRHKYKIVVGVPMAFLLASSLSMVRSPEEMCIVPEDNRFVEVGETVTLHVFAESSEPVNVISGSVWAPEDLVLIKDTSRELSIIDLWTKEPEIVENTVSFAGGIISPDGFLGSGVVLAIIVEPLAEGKATIEINDVTMLAHDGTGRPVECAKNPIVLSIRPTTHQSPDVNGDNNVNLFDFGLVSTRLFLSYEKSYDLNMDGRITFADLGIILSNLSGDTRQSSLALFAH